MNPAFVYRDRYPYGGTSVIVLAAGQNLLAGTVLGRVTLQGANVIAGNNAGNGTLTLDLANPHTDQAEPGDYRVTCFATAPGGGAFRVTTYDHRIVGDVSVGTTFHNKVKFTLSPGDVDFAVGDGFVVRVTKGSGHHVQLDPNAADGSRIPAAILLRDTDASMAAAICWAVTRNTQVNPAALIWPPDFSDAQIGWALDELATRGIHY